LGTNRNSRRQLQIETFPVTNKCPTLEELVTVRLGNAEREAELRTTIRSVVAVRVDRFDSKLLLKQESSSIALRELVAGRIAPAYEQTQFVPPYPTYPFADGFL
jgi:hypothetical protein